MEGVGKKAFKAGKGKTGIPPCQRPKKRGIKGGEGAGIYCFEGARKKLTGKKQKLEVRRFRKKDGTRVKKGTRM